MKKNNKKSILFAQFKCFATTSDYCISASYLKGNKCFREEHLSSV
jgi:hypothetical protein